MNKILGTFQIMTSKWTVLGEHARTEIAPRCCFYHTINS